MSYSVYLKMDTGNGSNMSIDIGDPTYNLSPMFNAALGMSLRDLDGMYCMHALAILRKAIEDMEDHGAKYRNLNPQNGWGTYEGALEFLNEFKAACAEHPLARVFVR